MADSAHHQSSFLGGVWGPLSQGRSDLPAYHQALNVSVNGITVEEGAWVRRSGFQFLGTSRGRSPAKLAPYTAGDASPFVLEFTDSHLRFWSGTGRVFGPHQSTITASSLASGVFSITVDNIHDLIIGDDIMIFMPEATTNYQLIAPVRNRTMRVTNIVGAVLTVKDDQGNAFTGLTSNANALLNFLVYQVYDKGTSWTGQANLNGLRTVAAEDKAFILSSTLFPQLLSTATYTSGNVDATFSLAAASFKDGPYLDQQGTFAVPETGTVSAYTGSITFTPTSSTFVAADVGRHIRLFSQPVAWNSGTTYTYGQTVTYQGKWWKNIAAGSYSTNNVNVIPGTLATVGSVQVAVWAAAPTEGQWAWGTITAQASTSCTVSLVTVLNSANGTTVAIWRLGVYHSGQYPTCGLFHEGRLWLAGAVANRFDASISSGLGSDGSITFSPTDPQGIVLDSSGISETLSTTQPAAIYWMAPDHQGILVGTLTGEWLIQASTLNDPLTPLTIQAHQITKYQCANIEPVRAGMALVFVQRYFRRLLEYLADAFSGKFSARHVNEFAKHLSETGIFDLAYQEETVPVLWCKMEDGSLAGCTYRRISRFITEAPAIQAWHKHILGGDYANDLVRLAQSICTQSSAAGGTTDMLYVSSSDASNANYYIECLRPLLEEA